ncbi:MAG TPA: hypothetical protein VGY53_13375, partial [Isosphaeraceae bacterium]|nr:hypothetical protein [Isosphaeraceae bacterium]
ARELLRRMEDSQPGRAWKIWTGGDAPLVMSQVELGPARYVADLVLLGLARLAFPKQTRDPRL